MTIKYLISFLASFLIFLGCSNGLLELPGSTVRIEPIPDGALHVISTEGAANTIYIGGIFNSVGGFETESVARIFDNGSVDTSFRVVSADGFVNSLVHTNNQIYIGGNFTSINGISTPRIARLNSDGSVDTSFNPGTGFETTVYDIEIMPPANTIYVAGAFETFAGVDRDRIVRLLTSGGIDIGFNAGTVTGLVADIEPTDLASNSFYAVGNFGQWQGTARPRSLLVRTDGTIDPTFGTFSANVFVFAAEYISNQLIVLGGDFNQYNAVASQRLVSVHTDNAAFSAFNPGFNQRIEQIIHVGGGQLYVGGEFTQYNAAPHSRLARISTNNVFDGVYATKIGTGFNARVRALALNSENKLYVGGDFTTFNSIDVSSLIRLNSDGTIDTTFIDPN